MVTSAVAPHRLLTVEDWAALPEDDPGELVDGVLEEEELPDYVHEVAVAWLVSVLRSWVVPRGGIAAGSEAKFALGPRHGRKPDVSLYFPESRKPPRRGAVRVPPDLAVEVLSPKARDEQRDRVDKPDEYARFGIRHYWILDPEQRILECWRLGTGGSYERLLGASVGRVAVPGFDDLELDLDALWAETDRLERAE
jgi:Uma2 family endonuclease